MKKENLKNHIRRLYYTRLAISILILAATIVIFNVNPFDKRFGTVTPDNLSSVSELYNSRSNYVKTTVDKLLYTGVDYTVNGKTKAHFYYTIEDGKCYYFILSDNFSKNFSPTLTDVTMNARLIKDDILYESLITNLSADVKISTESLASVSNPIFISQYSFIHSFATFYTVATIIITIICLIVTTMFIIVIINPAFSNTVLSLSKYGNRRTLFAIAEMEYDISTATGRKNLYLTDTFLISITRTNVTIIPLENIVWIYKYNELHQSKGRTKMTHPLCIVTDQKKLYKLRHMSESVSELIASKLLERYPEIMYGYDKR